MKCEPHIFFTGNCEEALNYYKDVFKGEIVTLMRWKEMPKDVGGPPVTPETENLVMHARFESAAVTLMGGDATPGKTYGEGPISLSLSTKDVDEGQRVFDALAAGGKVEMPFQDAFWNAKFGMVTDKFGIDWMVNCEH